MTYCVGLLLDEGLVMLGDTRTNAGFDNISCFSKLQKFHQPGERLIATLTAGNLAISQAVLNLIQEGLPDPETGQVETIYTVPTMFRAAALVGEAVRRVHKTHGEAMKQQGVGFDVSIMLGGQIEGRTLRLFHVYAAGNFIEATTDTPYLQIGEHKYGKPMLDRAVTRGLGLSEGVKLALISMDSTLRSNLSVGMPLDLLVYRNDSIDGVVEQRIEEGDEYFSMMRERWSQALSEAHRQIPAPGWLSP
ncbi:peptidase [Novilysobacter spongiicola]|uniref:Putative proteasome-type protease n=1 Tax=Lysobacter spongiicola DSM 21749 TaxID=1122188 RepID=A0A1T4R991_9GAMM|nr:peptidase [Lysobacter spongiicola]SKA12238.1 putative proteasome-type protease [Lysobacter spongiicola DSM 21749]